MDAIPRFEAKLGALKILTTACFFLLGVICSNSTQAASKEHRWTLKLAGGVSLTADDSTNIIQTLTGPIAPDQATHSVSDGSGFGLSLEYRITRRLLLEANFSQMDYDTSFLLVRGASGAVASLRDDTTVSTDTLSLGLNYRLTPDKYFDFTAGIFLAMLKPEDLFFTSGSVRSDKLTFDDDTGAGLMLRLDLPFTHSRRWVASVEARALQAIFESEFRGQDLDLNPLQVMAGIGYRF